MKSLKMLIGFAVSLLIAAPSRAGEKLRLEDSHVIVFCQQREDEGSLLKKGVADFYLVPSEGIYLGGEEFRRAIGFLTQRDVNFSENAIAPFSGILGYQVILDNLGNVVALVSVQKSGWVFLRKGKEKGGRYYYDGDLQMGAVAADYVAWYLDKIADKESNKK